MYACAENLPQNRRTHIVILETTGSQSIIAPFSVEREGFWTKLRSLGSGYSDYEPTVITNDPMKAAIELCRYLKDWNEWDCLSYWDIPEESLFLKALKDTAEWDVQVEESRISPFIELKGGFQEIWSRVPKKIRADTNRQERRLSEIGNISLVKLTTPREVSEGLNNFFAMHMNRWNLVGMPSQFESIATRRFYKQLAMELRNTGTLDFRGLYVGNQICAMHFGFIYNNKFWYFLPTFDVEFQPYSVGRILLKKLVETACFKDLEVFDFLLGNEDYKFSWPVSQVQTHNATIFNHTIGGYAAKSWHQHLKPRIKKLPLAQEAIDIILKKKSLRS